MQEDCKVGEGIEPCGRCHAQIFQAEQVCATAESRWLLGKVTRRCGPTQEAIRKKEHMVQLNLRVGQVQCASHNSQESSELLCGPSKQMNNLHYKTDFLPVHTFSKMQAFETECF